MTRVFDPAALYARLAAVRDRIARAAARAGRDPASIRLVAVSKTFDADYVRAAAKAGQIDFGENKVQEALQKQPATTDLQIRWHLVGHLQSNKARKAGSCFDLIHSIDDAALVAKIDAGAVEADRQVEWLIQVDLAREPTKHGAREDDLMPIVDAARACRAARLTGLMLLPPATDNPDEARRWFRELRSIRDRLVTRGVDESMVSELSMGMSHDYEVAIEEGATLVRVGTAIFGSRPDAV